MSFVLLSDVVNSDLLKNIRLIATDMDGTLTQKSKFTPQLIQALEDLDKVNIKVLIVTGRSAGWVSGLATYLPIAGAIAENGGLFYLSGNDAPITLTPISNFFNHRQQLAEIFQKLQIEFPQLQETNDNRFRMTDWTFDVQGLSVEQLQYLSKKCYDLDWGFTYSNVQCHIKPLNQDKAIGLLQVLREYFSEYALEQVMTVGDSPNDESLFDANKFPLSVGVNNVLHYVEQMTHRPAYITTASEGKGFCELVKEILRSIS
jgi:hypothetical protein